MLADSWIGPAGTGDDGPIRAAVVGAGFAGTAHALAIRRAGARLVGVVASSGDSGRRAAAALGAERAFPDVESLVASDVDVVHICTPNHLHGPLARAALAVGKHVVCEKPLTMGVDEAHELVGAARAAGVVATVPFVYRFYPMVREARARLASGDIGPIRLLHGMYLQDWLSTAADDNWRVDPDLGGPSRAFADIGSHWCDLIEFVTGDRIAAVCAEMATVVPERGSSPDRHAPAAPPGSAGGESSPASVDLAPTRQAVATEDLAAVLFRTRRGVAGSVVISQISHGRTNRLQFEVVGAEATLSFEQEQPDWLWVGRRGASELVVRDPAHLAPEAARYAVLPPGHPQGYQGCFDAFVADTYRAARAGDAGAVDGLPDFADGARAAVITDAALRSARQRGWVDVPS